MVLDPIVNTVAKPPASSPPALGDLTALEVGVASWHTLWPWTHLPTGFCGFHVLGFYPSFKIRETVTQENDLTWPWLEPLEDLPPQNLLPLCCLSSTELFLFFLLLLKKFSLIFCPGCTARGILVP